MTRGANEYILRCRALYRIANLPREHVKFFNAMAAAREAVKVDSVAALDGWNIRKSDAFNSFTILQVVHSQLEDYFRGVIENISASMISAGSTFSVVVTRGGSGWAFGSSSHGQIGQGSLVSE